MSEYPAKQAGGGFCRNTKRPSLQ